MDDALLAYTFLRLGPKQVATHVDLHALGPDGVQAHAVHLLRGRASATAVQACKGEVYREPARSAMAQLAACRDMGKARRASRRLKSVGPIAAEALMPGRDRC